VEAAKAWFFGDAATISLGTAINRLNGCELLPLTTSLQQSNQFGDVFIGNSAAAGPAVVRVENGSVYTVDDPTRGGRKPVVLVHGFVKMIILPRQARDKHRQHSTEEDTCVSYR
jgi:hypothetical protein